MKKIIKISLLLTYLVFSFSTAAVALTKKNINSLGNSNKWNAEIFRRFSMSMSLVPSVPIDLHQDRTICGSGSTKLETTPGSEANTVRWYTVSSGGTYFYQGTVYNTPTLTSAVVYYVSSYNTITNLESARIPFPVAVTPVPPSVPTVVHGSRCGTGVVTLSATSNSPGATIRWYNSAGTYITSGTNYSPTLSASAVFQVETFLSACSASSSRIQVNATVNPLPSTPTLNSFTTCPGAVNLPAAWSGQSLRWYAASAGGAPIPNTQNISTTATFWGCTYTSLCESQRVPLTVTIVTPGVPIETHIDRIICGSGNTALEVTPGANATTVRWYTAASGGTHFYQGVEYDTPILTGPTMYYISSYNEIYSCESPRIAFGNIVSPLPVAPAVTHEFRFGPGIFTLSAVPSNAQSEGIHWYSNEGTYITSGNTYSPNVSASTVFKVRSYKLSTGCLSPFVSVNATLQLDGTDMNYVATNKLLHEISSTDQIPSVTDVTQVVDGILQTVQYFDGLGRPVQTVNTQASPSSNDIVSPIAYDRYGREFRKYLPFTPLEKTGAYKDNIIDPATGAYTGIATTYSNGLDGIPIDSRPFAETVFEASPLNRVAKQGAPGEAWQPDALDAYSSEDHTVKRTYEINGPGEVLFWSYTPPTAAYPLGFVNAGTAASPIYYNEKQVFKNRIKDEHQNDVIEYIDKLGRAVLKKVRVSASQYASTYYIYDNFGNLVCVIPPEAVSKLGTEYYHATATDATKDDFLSRWAFRYAYDARKRMTQKKVPGASAVYMVYDKRTRLVLTQDGNQRSGATKYWTFTKYDFLNRPIATGIKDTAVALTQAEMQNAVNAHYAKPWTKYGEIYIGSATGNIHGYTNKSYPVMTGPTTAIDPNQYTTVTYYDNYDFRSMWSGTYTYYNDALNQTINTAASVFVTGLVTGTKVKVLDGGITGGYTWQKTANYYDDKYRMIQVQSDNYKGGIDRVSNLYDFPGKLLKSKETHVEYDPAWQNMSNVTRTGNKLVATINGWGNSGAASIQTLSAGQNGWVECLASETTTGRIFGLSDTNPDLGFASIRYGIQQSSSGLYAIESGAQTLLTPTYNPGDILTIERVGSVINYKYNGSTVKSTTGALTTQLFIDVAMNNINGTLVGLRSSFSTSSKSIVRTFAYDHAGRLTETWHQMDNGPVILLSKNEYNELGQLVDKKLHSTVAAATDAKQSVDYRYNIRGWLTSINNASLSSDNGGTNNETGDYFGMNLAYNTADPGVGNSPMYNGNISGLTWSNNLGLGMVKQNGYSYSYDPMNRIIGSAFKEKAATWSIPPRKAFAETDFLYDLNGNIQRLVRNDKRGTGKVTMDSLIYNYGTGTTQSNKLLKVVDNGDDFTGFLDGINTGNDYTYDLNGNMITDQNKGITTAITYNYLNLPELVARGSNTLRYIYDATGRKLAQIATFTGATKQTDYSGEFTYENDVLQFISHEEGRIVVAGTKLIYTNPGESIAGIVASNATLNPVVQNGTEKYVKAVSNGTVARTGMFPVGGMYPVVAGERYRIRAKGYRDKGTAASSSTAYLLVQVNGTDLGWPGAALPVSLATAQTESWIEQVVTIPAGGGTTRYLEAGIVWNTVLAGEIIYLNEFEITKLESNAPEYQYNLKDHLGNVRLTFTTKLETETSKATMETATAASEQGKFLYYDEAVKVNYALFDHTGTGPTYYSTRLTGGNTNAKFGLAKSLSVMPGDVINMEVYAKYLDPIQDNLSEALELFIASIAPGGGAPAGTIVDGGAAGSIGGGTYPFSTIDHASETGTPPKAYLNYVVVDRTMTTVLDAGYSRITASSRESGQDADHDHLTLNYTAKKPGYIYIYLSNENPTAVEVYFDDFKVDHIKSPIIQLEDYYPFGLTFNSCQRENNIDQNYLYNGKELQDELNLGWSDYGARMYLPEIGRWGVNEPFGMLFPSISTYSYAWNDPISYIDRDGKIPVLVATALIGGAVGGIYGLATGKTWKQTLALTAGGFVAGATLGLGTAAVGVAGGASSILTATLADAVIGTAYIGATNAAYVGLGTGVVGDMLGELAQQRADIYSGEQTDFDKNDIVLNGVFGIAEFILGPLTNRLGDVAKNSLKEGASQALTFTYKAENEYRKSLVQQLMNATAGQGPGGAGLTRKEAELIAQKLVNETKETNATVLNVTIKVVDGVIDVSFAEPATTATEELEEVY